MTESFHSFSSTTTFYAIQNDQNTPTGTPAIPIESSPQSPIRIPVHLPQSMQSTAAVKIQSAYRSHLVRTLVKKISAVHSEADRFERLIQWQETVDAVRRDAREKIRMNEGLMTLLLKLDSVPGYYPSVRELRRFENRRIVGLCEVLDAVSEAKVLEIDRFFPVSLGEICEQMKGRDHVDRGRGDCENAEEKVLFRCLEKLGLWSDDAHGNVV